MIPTVELQALPSLTNKEFHMGELVGMWDVLHRDNPSKPKLN
jgi:hypothetical protein